MSQFKYIVGDAFDRLKDQIKAKPWPWLAGVAAVLFIVGAVLL